MWIEKLTRLNRCLLYLLLCVFLVAPMLTGCRRQGSHVESVEADEEANQDPVPVPEPDSEGSDIIFEDSISRGRSVHALSGQLLLTVTVAYDPEKLRHTTKLRMKFSDKEEEIWPDLAVGGRRIVEFKSVEYMVDVLEVDKYGARIAIVRKRG